MRIVSLLPTATEILRGLGAAGDIVGLSHDHGDLADRPDVPVLTRLAFDEARMNAAEIDAAVSGAAARQEDLYSVDAERLVSLRPDLVITQELCRVCAITPGQLQRALKILKPAPLLLTLGARTLAEAEADFMRVAEAVARPQAGSAIIDDWARRRQALAHRLAPAPGQATVPCPRVACLEWPDPIYNAGHWVPEMVAAAGGIDVLGRPGVYSERISWEQLRAAQPEVIVVMACGLNRERAYTEAAVLRRLPGFSDLPAVGTGRVWVVDGPACFSQAGPRLIDGIEILSRLIHPGTFAAPSAEFAVPLV